MRKRNGPGALAGAAEAVDRVSAGAQPDSTIPRPALSPEPAEAACDYHRRGWAVVPIPSGQKRPAMSGWPEFRAAADDLPKLFGRGENIGIILGASSGELVDIDLDCS